MCGPRTPNASNTFMSEPAGVPNCGDPIEHIRNLEWAPKTPLTSSRGRESSVFRRRDNIIRSRAPSRPLRSRSAKRPDQVNKAA